MIATARITHLKVIEDTRTPDECTRAFITQCCEVAKAAGYTVTSAKGRLVRGHDHYVQLDVTAEQINDLQGALSSEGYVIVRGDEAEEVFEG